jgi:pimeloyl-ACP methyl ester carboxylesterase
MAYALLAGMRMYYEEAGRADGPPLVLLHGFTGTGAREWNQHLAPLGERYRLIVPDLRGHGRTDNPGGSAAMNHRQFARDIASLCDSLGVDRSAFCGQSSGSMLLLSLALSAPALAGACVFGAGTYFFGEEVRSWQRSQTPESLVEARFPGNSSALQEFKAAHTALGPEHWRVVLAAWLGLAENAHSDDFPEAEELAAIDVPFLVLHGDRDRFFPVEVPTTLYGSLPDSELCILPQTGHGIPSERPSWFDEIALDFLERRYTTL